MRVESRFFLLLFMFLAGYFFLWPVTDYSHNTDLPDVGFSDIEVPDMELRYGNEILSGGSGVHSDPSGVKITETTNSMVYTSQEPGRGIMTFLPRTPMMIPLSKA